MSVVGKVRTYGEIGTDMQKLLSDDKFKQIDAKNIRSLLAKIGCPGKGKAYGGRIEFQEGLSPEVCMTRGAQVIQEKRID